MRDVSGKMMELASHTEPNAVRRTKTYNFAATEFAETRMAHCVPTLHSIHSICKLNAKRALKCNNEINADDSRDSNARAHSSYPMLRRIRAAEPELLLISFCVLWTRCARLCFRCRLATETMNENSCTTACTIASLTRTLTTAAHWAKYGAHT